MDRIEGGNLQNELEKLQVLDSPIPERRIWKFITQMVLAIANLKIHELVHCDIKASNILLVDDNHIVLCDFDATVKSDLKMHENTRLTPYYAR